MREAISHDELLRRLSFDPKTGVFRWLIRPRQRVCSEEAGVINPEGYRQIGLCQSVYKAHRLAWFYIHGVWPRGDIDHINGIRSDNRIENLREATRAQNAANAKSRKKHKGVYLHKASGLYHARVTVNYRAVSLGYFKSVEAAHAAYCVAEKKFFGDYAREG